MKEYNYISVLDGFLRAKIYLWMINVILYVRSFRVAKNFSAGWNTIDGSQHIVFFCYKQKKMDNFLDDQFQCLLYLSYLLYSGRLCRGDHTDGRNIGSRF